MPSLIGSSLLRNVASFVAVLCVVLGGTWAAVHLTTNHLLYQNATAAARSWAQFLTANVTDLEQIAAGEKPSSASMAFFVHAQKSDQVFRYEIYDRSGFSLLVSDHNNDLVTIVGRPRSANRGRINNEMEYQTITDAIVIQHQMGKISAAEAERLDKMLGQFGERASRRRSR
jgi:hypothetical protein